jgi:hypothetical protein
MEDPTPSGGNGSLALLLIVLAAGATGIVILSPLPVSRRRR